VSNRNALHVQLADEAVLHRRSPQAARAYLQHSQHQIAAANFPAAAECHPSRLRLLAENDPSPEICIAQAHLRARLPKRSRAMGARRPQNHHATGGVPTITGSDGLLKDPAHAPHWLRPWATQVMIKATAAWRRWPCGLVPGPDPARLFVSRASPGRAKQPLAIRRLYIREIHPTAPPQSRSGAGPTVTGHVIHLGERGLARFSGRHQKLAGKNPSPALDPDLRPPHG